MAFQNKCIIDKQAVRVILFMKPCATLNAGNLEAI